MRFQGIRLIEKTEQNFRHIRACLEDKKTSDCSSRAFILKAPTKYERNMMQSAMKIQWQTWQSFSASVQKELHFFRLSKMRKAHSFIQKSSVEM